MRIFFDTEFVETGENGVVCIELISVALVDDDGRELYLENALFDWDREMPDEFHRDHVRPHLLGPGHPSWQTPDQMARSIETFVGDRTPEWWARTGSYDFVALSGLWGRLLDRPQGWPTVYQDIKWLRIAKKVPKDKLPAQTGTAHRAIDDARHNREVVHFLDGVGGA